MSSENRCVRIVMPLSFFPRSMEDQVPRFVEDQVHAFLRYNPCLEITILVPHYGNTLREERRDGFRIIRFHYFWPQRWERLSGAGIMPAIKHNPWLFIQVPFMFLFEWVALLRTLRQGQYDYIYAHWFTPQGVVAGLVSRLTGIPFGFTSHSSDVEIWQRLPWLGRFVVRHIVLRANAVTVVSRRSRDKLKWFFNEAQWRRVEPKVAIIPMGVNVKDFESLTLSRDELKIRYSMEGNRVLFFIGRLVEKKGLSYLLQAFAKLVATDGSLRLVIAGDGQIREELVRLTQTLGISDHVRFVGFVTGREKAEFFGMADILLVPSIVTTEGDAEGLPVSLLEGMASGMVCIATGVSGADDILTDGVDGLVIEDRSVEAIVAAVSRILKMSDESRANLQKCARRQVMNLDWSIVAKRHLDHLLRGLKDR